MFSASLSFGANGNSSWQAVGQAKIKKNIRTAVPFRSDWTLEQNNRNLQNHRSKSVIVSSTVPTSTLSSIQLLNRSASWHLQNQAFTGRVTAVMLSEDQQSVTVFAEITIPKTDQHMYAIHEAGLLSVEG